MTVRPNLLVIRVADLEGRIPGKLAPDVARS